MASNSISRHCTLRSGRGGLIMVGGPNSFVAGGYAGTPLAEVLPVVKAVYGSAADPSLSSRSIRPPGKRHPSCSPSRLARNRTPSHARRQFPGQPPQFGRCPWTHPKQVTPSGHPMPVLAAWEVGTGRSIALGIDGAFRLQFSNWVRRPPDADLPRFGTDFSGGSCTTLGMSPPTWNLLRAIWPGKPCDFGPAWPSESMSSRCE